ARRRISGSVPARAACWSCARAALPSLSSSAAARSRALNWGSPSWRIRPAIVSSSALPGPPAGRDGPPHRVRATPMRPPAQNLFGMPGSAGMGSPSNGRGWRPHRAAGPLVDRTRCPCRDKQKARRRKTTHSRVRCGILKGTGPTPPEGIGGRPPNNEVRAVTIPWQIRVFQDQQLTGDCVSEGPVELGRQGDPAEERFKPKPRPPGWRVAVAPLGEQSVSRQHALLEPAGDRMRVSNLSEKQIVRLLDGELPPRARGKPPPAAVVALPALLTLGGRTVR